MFLGEVRGYKRVDMDGHIASVAERLWRVEKRCETGLRHARTISKPLKRLWLWSRARLSSATFGSRRVWV